MGYSPCGCKESDRTEHARRSPQSLALWGSLFSVRRHLHMDRSCGGGSGAAMVGWSSPVQL